MGFYKSRIDQLVLCLPHIHHTTNTITLLHDFKGLVKILERLTMGDKLVDLELTLHVVINEIWKLAAAFDTTKGTASPNTTGDELECCSCVSLYYQVVGRRGLRRVEISCPAAATPMTILCPQPLWQASSAARITLTLPVQSKV